MLVLRHGVCRYCSIVEAVNCISLQHNNIIRRLIIWNLTDFVLHSAGFLAVLSVHKSHFFHSFPSQITLQQPGKGIYFSENGRGQVDSVYLRR